MAANNKAELAKANNGLKKGQSTQDNTDTPTDTGGLSISEAGSPGKGQNTSTRVAQTNNAAKDDSFSGENTSWLLETGGLSGSLDVLANDPGSASIFAVHGELPEGDGPVAPTTETTVTVEHNGAEYEVTLSINDDGTVAVDASSLSGNLALAEGETLEVTFYYTAQMGKNGVLSTAEVTIELVGEDVPAEISGDDTGTVQEDGTLEAAGTLVVTDADAGEAVFEAPADLAGTYGDFTFDPVTGEWTYTLRNDEAVVQDLTSADLVTDTLTVTSFDGSASHDIVISVEGADEPVEGATDLTNGGFEAGLEGFSTVGSAGTVETSDAGGTAVTPTEGTLLLALSTETDFGGTTATAAEIETFLGLGADSLTGLGNGDAVEGAAVQTSLFLAAGQTLTFDYFFDTQEQTTTNDFAFLSLSPSTLEEIADVEAVGDFGDTGWVTYSFTATDAGTYDLGLGVVDSGDAVGTSVLYVDNLLII